MVTRVAVGEKVRAAKVNELVDLANLTGQVGVIPGSVSGAGVSFDSTTGIISFSSATSITVDDCFTSDFRNYRIFCESTGTAATYLFQFRNGTSTVSSANYDRTELLARNGTVSSSTNTAGTSWTILGIANTLIQWDMELSAPNVAVPTTALTRGATHSNPAASNNNNGIVQNYLTHRLSVAYEGFVLTLSNAQSGTLRVVGLT